MIITCIGLTVVRLINNYHNQCKRTEILVQSNDILRTQSMAGILKILILVTDCFQMTLYIMVLVNVTKQMKNHIFCGARLSINIWNFWIKIGLINPAPFQKFSGVICLKNSQCRLRNVHHHFVSFILFQPKQISIFLWSLRF